MSFEIPKTRSEKILQNILGAKNEIEPIQSRIEAILFAILNDTEIGDPYTAPARCEIEKLLVAIKDGGEYNETPLTRSGRILLCKLRGDDYTGTTQSRLEKLFLRWLYELMEITDVPPFTFKSKGNNLIDYDIYGAEDGVGNNEDKTVSGNPISVSDAIEAPADSLQVTFVPTQDGTPSIDSEPTIEPYLSKVIPRGNKEYYSLVGGTVAWNQIAPTEKTRWLAFDSSITGDSNEWTLTSNTDNITVKAMGIRFPINHVAFCSAYLKTNTDDSDIYAMIGLLKGGGVMAGRSRTNSNSYTLCQTIAKMPSDATQNYFQVRMSNDAPQGTSINAKEVVCVDLTQMFGSTIADYIYTLEQTESGSGIAWLKSYGFFTKDYYPYNEGELISVNTSAHRTIGFNQFNAYTASQWLKAYIGDNLVANDNMRTAILPCLPNTEYYAKHSKGSRLSVTSFKTYPSIGDAVESYAGSTSSGGHVSWTTGKDDHYLAVYFYNANVDTGLTVQDVAYTLVVNIHSERDGEYEPYDRHTYQLDSTDLRGLFKLDSANKLYCEGDIYPPSGSVERKYGIVDLGTLEWSIISASNVYITTNEITDMVRASGDGNPQLDILCGKYVATPTITLAANMPDKMCSINSAGKKLMIKDSAYATVSELEMALSGTYFVYPLETPTTESATPYTSPIDVEAGGTEEFIDNRTVPIPVGNETYYASEYEVHGKASVSVDHSATSSDTPTTYTISLAPVGDNIIPYDLDYIKSINSRGEWDGDTYTYLGISYEFQSDGSVILNGTATGGSGVWYWVVPADPMVPLHIPEGYILSGVSGGGFYTYSLDVDSHRCYDPEVLSERNTVAIGIDVLRGTTVNNLRIKPAITPPVYGGTVDIVTGALTVTWAKILNPSTANWGYSTSNGAFNLSISGRALGVTNLMCNKYPTSSASTVASMPDKSIKGNENYTTIYVKDSMYNGDITTFKASLADVTIAYELATPLTYQLTTQQVQMLLNDNYLETPDGTITLTYKGPGINVPFSVSCGGGSNSYKVDLSDKLYKVGAYADSISYDDQTVKREIIVEHLTGTEEWVLNDGVFSTALGVVARTPAVLCNELTTDQCYLSDDLTTLNVTGVPQTSVEEFVTWLRANDVYVQYVREQTLVTSHTVPAVSTFNGTNTFSVDTEVTPSEVTIIYPNRVTTRTLPKTKKIGKSKLTKSK